MQQSAAARPRSYQSANDIKVSCRRSALVAGIGHEPTPVNGSFVVPELAFLWLASSPPRPQRELPRERCADHVISDIGLAKTLPCLDDSVAGALREQASPLASEPGYVAVRVGLERDSSSAGATSAKHWIYGGLHGRTDGRGTSASSHCMNASGLITK